MVSFEPSTGSRSLAEQPRAAAEVGDGAELPSAVSEDSSATAVRSIATAWVPRLARPIGYFLLSRAAVLFAVLVVKWLFPAFNALQALGAGWDGGWYVRIAEFGYPHRLFNEGGGSRWAFFPGFPAAIRACVDVTGLPYADAGIFVALLFGALSSIGVWLAVSEVFGGRVADRATLLYVFFPAAYVLSMAYTEGLFIGACAFALYAMSRRRWIAAAILVNIACLTRNIGAILIVALAVSAITAMWSDGRLEVQRRAMLAVLVSPLGFLAWLAFSWHEVGTPIAFVKAERFWGGAHFAWFTTPFLALAHLASGVDAWKNAPDVLAAAALVFMIIGLALLVKAQRGRHTIPLAWWVVAVGSVLGALSPFWATSILRYSMAAFPLFAAIALDIRARWFNAIVGVCGVSQGALAVIILAGLIHPQATLLAP